MAPEYSLNVGRRTIADVDPDDLWRWAVQQASLVKVRVFRNDGQSSGRRIVPHRLVVCPPEADVSNVCRFSIAVGEQLDEVMREVLVEEESHAGTLTSLRSRSAAN